MPEDSLKSGVNRRELGGGDVRLGVNMASVTAQSREQLRHGGKHTHTHTDTLHYYYFLMALYFPHYINLMVK